MAKFPILVHFGYYHLPAALAKISKPFHELAHNLTLELAPGPELSAALRKLLEAKDAAVRAAIDSGALHRSVPPPVTPEQLDARRVQARQQVDPITGQPLPEGSPYSMAHEPVRPAGVDPHAPLPDNS